MYRHAFTRLGRRMAAIVFADCCVLCGNGAAEATVECGLCAGCRGELPRIRSACDRCGRPVPAPLPAGFDCSACRRRPPPFCAARAPLEYAFPVDAALKALKFDARLQYAPVFAGLMMAELDAAFPGVDALAPVPLHRRRHAMRGFNQAYELARPLARLSGLPILTATRRIRNTPPQTGLAARARRRNMRGAFATTGRLGCRHPLIIDDVMTTGETCGQLAGVLLAAGADRVSVLTAARAVP